MKVTQINSMIAANAGRLRTIEMSLHMERLSSGLRINRGADDPSGLGISTRMRATTNGLQTAIHNIQDGINLLQTADSAMGSISNAILRCRDISVRAANEVTLTSNDRTKLQNEIESLISGANQTAEKAEFNGVKLLTGGVTQTKTFTIDSKADWDAGTQTPAGSLDSSTSPGDISLKVIPWSSAPGFNTSVGDKNEQHLNLLVSSYSDNGDGTANVTLSFRAEAVAGTTDYKGKLFLDPRITNVMVAGFFSSNLAYAGGGVIDFQSGAMYLRGNPPDRQVATVSFTAPLDAVDWNLNITSPNLATAKLIYGTTTKTTGTPAAVNGAFSDIYTSSKWQSGVMDTGMDVGGDGTFAYTDSQPAGTGISYEISQSADGVGGWTQVSTSSGPFSFTERYLRVEATLTSPGIASGTPTLSDMTVNVFTTRGTVLQVGPENMETQHIELEPVDARTAMLGVGSVSVLTASGAGSAIDTFDSALDYINDKRAYYGTSINHLNSIINDLSAEYLGVINAQSNITDANFPEEASAFIRSRLGADMQTQMANMTNAEIKQIGKLVDLNL